MTNEDPNNSFHWRDKLDGLEHLPGGTFNKNSAWDKLHDRVQGKKSNRKLLWYWMAAACLFFVLIITLVNYYQHTSTPVPPGTVEKKAAIINTAVSTAAENKKVDAINTGSPVKNKMASVTQKSSHTDHKTIRNEIISKTQLNNTPGILLEAEPVAKTLQIPNATLPVAISLPEKKKLKVVHINELGDPVENFPDVVRKTDNHSFKLKLGNEEVYADPLVASKTRGVIILKTNPSSN